MIGLGVAFLVLLALAAANTTKAAPSGGVTATGMPEDLKVKLAQALTALTVGPDGKIKGPITKEALQLATSIAGQLDAAGFKDAAAQLRAYISAAQAMLAPVPAGEQVPVPSIPADLQTMLNQALQTERDPKKLQAILTALHALPQTADVQHAEQLLEALIVQVQAQQAQQTALTQIDQTLAHPAPPPPFTPAPGVTTSPGWQNAMPNVAPGSVITPQGTVVAPAAVVPSAGGGAKVRSTLSVKAKSWGDDVADWQRDLTAAGFPVAVDKSYGTGTEAATKKWQASRGLAADGIVGPKSWAVMEGSGQSVPVAVTPVAAPVSMPQIVTSPIPGLPPVAVPGVSPLPQTPIEQAAAAMILNLKNAQGSFGMPGAKGREDKTLVMRFQSLATGTSKPDGLVGPGTMLSAATQGMQSDLPLVMYWPKSASAKDVLSYRQGLLNLAAAATAAGDQVRAANLTMSAQRERGQAGIVGPMPA